MTDDAITPDLLMQAYAAGIFPMAEARADEDIFWVDPARRGILPLDGFHLSKSLRKTIRAGTFSVSTDTAFASVVDGCAARPETWINGQIRGLYTALYASGDAHSLEVWANDKLAGGVYGVTLGGAFFGESMFSRKTDASKVALAYLIDLLRRGGFTLFDTQFITPHLSTLGGIEISRDQYRLLLSDAKRREARFVKPAMSPQDLLQRMTQTS